MRRENASDGDFYSCCHAFLFIDLKFAAVIAIIMMVLGIFALQKIPIEHMPNMDAPALGVSAGYRGASAGNR